MPACRPGVARCSLRSQTFAFPSLQYCGHCMLLKTDVSVVKNNVLTNRTRRKFLTDRHFKTFSKFQNLCDLSKIQFDTFFDTNVFEISHGSQLNDSENILSFTLILLYNDRWKLNLLSKTDINLFSFGKYLKYNKF